MDNPPDTRLFDVWNQKKKFIHLQSRSIYFREREIWWCNLGMNIGYEQNGKGKDFCRPVLIVRKFNQHMMWVVPLSTKIKKNPFYISCVCADGRTRSVIYTQLKTLSPKRLIDKMATIDEHTFSTIKKAIGDEL